MADSSEVLRATGLCKRFGSQRVIQSISLVCGRGEVALLLGANGVGKSSFLRMLSGLARPDAGSIVLSSGARVGFAAHHSFLYSKLSVSENLRLYGSFLQISKEHIESALERWALKGYAKTPISQLSKGTLAKVSLVRAMLGKPELLLLDEPSSNLDEASVELLKQEIRSYSANGAAIVATHDVSRLKEVATRILVLQGAGGIIDSGAGASPKARDEVIDRYYEANR